MVVKVPGIIAGACRTRGNLGPGLMIMVAMVVMVVEVVLMVMIVVVGGKMDTGANGNSDHVFSSALINDLDHDA